MPAQKLDSGSRLLRALVKCFVLSVRVSPCTDGVAILVCYTVYYTWGPWVMSVSAHICILMYELYPSQVWPVTLLWPESRISRIPCSLCSIGAPMFATRTLGSWLQTLVEKMNELYPSQVWPLTLLWPENRISWFRLLHSLGVPTFPTGTRTWGHDLKADALQNELSPLTCLWILL